MNHLSLSSEQYDVVNCSENRFTVRASAGAGKTRVLVEKYLRHIIDEHIRPDEILTVTFTKKAAAEMKRRIVSALIDQKLFKQAQIAETGPIQTLHSFCENILRENALAAGLDPQFKILSEAQSGEIFETALQNSLSQLETYSDDIQKLVRHLVGKFDYNAPRTIHSKLNNAIKSVLGTFRGLDCSLSELSQIYSHPKNLMQAYQNTIEKDLEIFTSIDLNQGDPNNWAQHLILTLKERKSKQLTWLKSGPTAFHPESVSLTCGLMQLALFVWSNMQQIMEKEQTFDFMELESRAVNLICSCSETQERLSDKYQVILVDESQDLNPVQYRLIHSLKIKMEMLVGDPQQSIYSFRQADRKLFMSKTRELNCKQLKKNYRSNAGIIHFIDHIFGKIWGDDYQPMALQDVQDSSDDIFGSCIPQVNFDGVELWMQSKKDPANTAYWVKNMIQQGESPGDIAILVRMSYHATELSKELDSLGIQNRITGGAEKYFTRLEIRDLANVLQALGDPYDDFSLLALLGSPIVNLSLDSIVLLSQEKPIFDALKEFKPEIITDKDHLTTFMSWFEPMTQSADRMAAWEVLSEVFHLSPYLEQLAMRPYAEQTLANVRKLLCLAADEPQFGPLAFAERIRNIQQIHHREGDAPAIDEDAHTVTIMTIHKAKGLEFPIVVLPDMYQKLNRTSREIVADPENRLLATKFDLLPTLFYQYIDEKRKKLEREEELRVLYVAMTRAQKRLCICVQPDGHGDTLAALVSKTLHLKNSQYDSLILRDAEAVSHELELLKH